MNSSKEAFTKEGLERRMYYGIDILNKYYDEYANTFENEKEVHTELYLKNCEIDGVPIRGQIDPDEANYEKRLGGDYWRQVMFYKALIESDKTQNLKVISGEIDFIEPEAENHKRVKIMISDDEFAFVRRQIKDTFSRIQNLEFEKGCEQDDCQWCTFNSYYQQNQEYKAEQLLVNSQDEMD